MEWGSSELSRVRGASAPMGAIRSLWKEVPVWAKAHTGDEWNRKEVCHWKEAGLAEFQWRCDILDATPEEEPWKATDTRAVRVSE